MIQHEEDITLNEIYICEDCFAAGPNLSFHSSNCKSFKRKISLSNLLFDLHERIKLLEDDKPLQGIQYGAK